MAVLVTQLQRNGAQALAAPDAEAATTAIAAIFDELGVSRAVMNPDPELIDLELPARFPEVAWTITGQVPSEALRAACAAADVGLAGATAALAETGSVVVESGAMRSRLVTLLPPACIIVVPTAAIVPDIFAWAARRPTPPPANVVIISGPSKSADIEQTLAVGVHGPGRLTVLIRDASHHPSRYGLHPPNRTARQRLAPRRHRVAGRAGAGRERPAANRGRHAPAPQPLGPGGGTGRGRPGRGRHAALRGAVRCPGR